ncbi:VPLPA-CTERM sorting domain-containing protein [Sulfitobacter sp. D35]|uniref:VPLPA-CTERM sorting domain-containing protein n=1 Tax=Sulfitobacter sp. D35 TaxID=3083252 RepID=UPI00296F22E5|nr:VPLPA-CTERM sorting domain-containing protein [Sulfitobacter sp. D35]MDW4500409.1 VPLPA-CTERM sorting domain-containing protein [Sulfitobacter sp. D35]
MFSVRTAIIAGLISAAPFAASAATIGFDALDASAGQPEPLMTFTEAGRTFSVSTTGNNDGAAIFDTTCFGYSGSCNGDPDLVPGVQGENGILGNIIILQENRTAPTPNDDASGGTIRLTLTSGSAFRWLGASAIDDGTFTFSTLADGVLGSLVLGSENQTGMTTFSSSAIGVGDWIELSYSGSGGIDSLQIQAVPVPAALPLALVGFGALGALAARRRRSQDPR